MNPERTEWRDARLARALEEAPDAQLRPLARTRDAIRAAAHEAVAPAAAPWWQRLWAASGRRSSWTPAVATVLLAGLVTLLWRGEEVPTAQPDAAAARRPAAPAATAATASSEADRPAVAKQLPPPVAPVLRDAPAAERQQPVPQRPPVPGDRAARKAAAPAAAPGPAAAAADERKAEAAPMPAGQPRIAPTPVPASPPAAAGAAAPSPAEARPAPPAVRQDTAALGDLSAQQAPPSAGAAPPLAAPAPAARAAPAAPPAAAAPGIRGAPPPDAAPPPVAESRAAMAPAPLGRARGEAADASSDRLAKSAAPPAASTAAAAPQRENATAFQAQQLSWEAWTELRITGEARAIVLARRRVPQLADQVNRIARLAQSLDPMQEPVRASFELSSRGNLLGVLEIGDTQVRWLPLGERGPSRTARPDAALLQAVREQADALLPR